MEKNFVVRIWYPSSKRAPTLSKSEKVFDLHKVPLTPQSNETSKAGGCEISIGPSGDWHAKNGDEYGNPQVTGDKSSNTMCHF